MDLTFPTHRPAEREQRGGLRSMCPAKAPPPACHTPAVPASIALGSAAPDSDEELVRRYCGGELQAFESLYRRHELKVFRYLLRTLRRRALAEELLQDVWFAIAREAPRYRPTARFTAWLYRIAHNRMIDALRRERGELSLDDPQSDVAHAVDAVAASRGDATWGAAVADEELAVLLGALGQLPAEQREAFLLQQEGELSVEEIAAVTGCPFETAKSRLRYARSRLRELLGAVA